MKITIQDSWTRRPEDFFFCPGVDAGLSLTTPLPPMWRRIPKARIAGASVSEHANIADDILSHVSTHFRLRSFRAGIETATVPVIAQNVVADGHFLSVNGKWLLTGAAGTRLRNRYSWKNEGRRDVDTETATFFAQLQSDDPPAPPIWQGPTGDLPFIVDARNGTNFYHFVTETLGQLCLVDHADFTGPVVIHTKGEIRDFIRNWVDAIFPRLRGRVEFVTKRARYDLALTPLNGRHLYYQTGPNLIPPLDELAPVSHFWKGRDPDRNSVGVFAMNSCDEMLVRLRDTAHALIADQDWSHLPRRFWVGRKSDRVREMAGEGELMEALHKRGFETVYFEDLSPLEQVAIMARAEVMMSYHGAGFANMIFAGRDTHCIELGTLQTCHFRWQDFMPHALASGCRYTSFFGDYNIEAPAEGVDDRRGKDLAPVAVGQAGRAKILGFIDAVLGKVRVTSLKRFQEIADLLSRLEDHAALRRLFDGHKGVEARDPDLMILKANALQGTGDDALALDALRQAWAATGDRPFLLERIILLGRELDQDVRAEEAAHGEMFPKRSQILSRKLKRLRRPGQSG